MIDDYLVAKAIAQLEAARETIRLAIKNAHTVEDIEPSLREPLHQLFVVQSNLSRRYSEIKRQSE